MFFEQFQNDGERLANREAQIELKNILKSRSKCSRYVKIILLLISVSPFLILFSSNIQAISTEPDKIVKNEMMAIFLAGLAITIIGIVIDAVVIRETNLSNYKNGVHQYNIKINTIIAAIVSILKINVLFAILSYYLQEQDYNTTILIIIFVSLFFFSLFTLLFTVSILNCGLRCMPKNMDENEI